MSVIEFKTIIKNKVICSLFLLFLFVIVFFLFCFCFEFFFVNSLYNLDYRQISKSRIRIYTTKVTCYERIGFSNINLDNMLADSQSLADFPENSVFVVADISQLCKYFFFCWICNVLPFTWKISKKALLRLFFDIFNIRCKIRAIRLWRRILWRREFQKGILSIIGRFPKQNFRISAKITKPTAYINSRPGTLGIFLGDIPLKLRFLRFSLWPRNTFLPDVYSIFDQ